MNRSVNDFLIHEIEEAHKNIDRIQNHMDHDHSVHISGQETLLAIQQEHLDMIEQLQDQVHNYDDLVEICRDNIVKNEELHSKIAYRDSPIHSQPSAEWWSTLHLIQFWGDMLDRVHNWQSRYAS